LSAATLLDIIVKALINSNASIILEDTFLFIFFSLLDGMGKERALFKACVDTDTQMAT
jgi:hypothetical protein